MIVIGYQGIGKSTLAKKNAEESCYVAILEYDWFKIENRPIDDFFDIIKNMTEHLNNQSISVMFGSKLMHSEIEKTKIALSSRNVYIDFESGNFWVNGVRNPEWYKVYAKIAMELSKQGFVVLTSSHEVVRNELYKLSQEYEYIDEDICVIAPDVKLREQWIAMLRRRYENTKKEKDYKALKNAEDRYEENIKELLSDHFDTAVIKDIVYDLEDIINTLQEEF